MAKCICHINIYNKDGSSEALEIKDAEAREKIQNLETKLEELENAEPGEGGSTVTVDEYMDAESTNPVQNKVVKVYIDDTYDELMRHIADAKVTVDEYMDAESTNPVQNKVVMQYVDNMGSVLQEQIDELKESAGAETDGDLSEYVKQTDFENEMAKYAPKEHTHEYVSKTGTNLGYVYIEQTEDEAGIPVYTPKFYDGVNGEHVKLLTETDKENIEQQIQENQTDIDICNGNLNDMASVISLLEERIASLESKVEALENASNNEDEWLDAEIYTSSNGIVYQYSLGNATGKNTLEVQFDSYDVLEDTWETVNKTYTINPDDIPGETKTLDEIDKGGGFVLSITSLEDGTILANDVEASVIFPNVFKNFKYKYS